MRDEKYLELLAEKYPTEQAVCREIINLKAILSPFIFQILLHVHTRQASA